MTKSDRTASWPQLANAGEQAWLSVITLQCVQSCVPMASELWPPVSLIFETPLYSFRNMSAANSLYEILWPQHNRAHLYRRRFHMVANITILVIQYNLNTFSDILYICTRNKQNPKKLGPRTMNHCWIMTRDLPFDLPVAHVKLLELSDQQTARKFCRELHTYRDTGSYVSALSFAFPMVRRKTFVESIAFLCNAPIKSRGDLILFGPDAKTTNHVHFYF